MSTQQRIGFVILGILFTLWADEFAPSWRGSATRVGGWAIAEVWNVAASVVDGAGHGHPGTFQEPYRHGCGHGANGRRHVDAFSHEPGLP